MVLAKGMYFICGQPSNRLYSYNYRCVYDCKAIAIMVRRVEIKYLSLWFVVIYHVVKIHTSVYFQYFFPYLMLLQATDIISCEIKVQ